MTGLTETDAVTVPRMPELGIGLIEWIIGPPFDRAVVSFEVDGHPYREDFALGEIEKATPTVKRTV